MDRISGLRNWCFRRTLVIASAALLILAVGESAWAQTPLDVDLIVLRLIHDVEIPAAEEGILKTVDVREGASVSAGDRLASLDDTAVMLAVEQARRKAARSAEEAESRVKIEAAEIANQFATSQLETAKAAVRQVSGSVTKAQMDELEHQVAQSQLGIKQAEQEQALAKATQRLDEAEFARAEHAIQQRTITSPLDGVVVQVMKQAGEWVQPGEGIARVVQLDVLRAEGYVDNRASATGLENRNVVVSVVAGGKTLEAKGRIVFVSPEVDPNDGKIRIWAEVDNRDRRLRPGLRGSMSIQTASPAASSSRNGDVH